jgi:guanylate kinase
MIKTAALFIVSAPSGAGKTTLCERLLQSVPNIVRSVSMTTRVRRPGEKHGRDYFFVSKKEFLDKIKRNEFLEYAKVFDNYYGTPRVFVEKAHSRNQDVLMTIDVQGAMKVRKYFRAKSVFIFILPPSMNVLKTRLKKRDTDTARQIGLRMGIAKKELSYVRFYDYKIVNDSVDDAYKKLAAIVTAARCRVPQSPGRS